MSKVLSYSPIAYWPMNEASGLVANCLVNPLQDGTYTGVTLGQTGIGDGETCPLWDGANDFNNIQTATLASAFSGAAGSLSLWMNPNPGVWTDGVARDIINLEADSENYVLVRKSSGASDDLLLLVYEAGDVFKYASRNMTEVSTWLHLALTWSAATDTLQGYFAGAPLGSAVSGLGVWAGSLAKSLIGALSTTPSQVWNGHLAHVSLFDSALSAATIADLATV